MKVLGVHHGELPMVEFQVGEGVGEARYRLTPSRSGSGLELRVLNNLGEWRTLTAGSAVVVLASVLAAAQAAGESRELEALQALRTLRRFLADGIG